MGVYLCLKSESGTEMSRRAYEEEEEEEEVVRGCDSHGSLIFNQVCGEDG